jgi:hypothetical protein
MFDHGGSTYQIIWNTAKAILLAPKPNQTFAVFCTSSKRAEYVFTEIVKQVAKYEEKYGAVIYDYTLRVHSTGNGKHKGSPPAG